MEKKPGMLRRRQLSDAKIKALKPKTKDYRVSDEAGLCIQVTAKGSKLWRLRYTFQKKEKMLALGKYPEIGLAAARRARDQARSEIAAGIDPALTKKKLQAQASLTNDTFRAVSEEWLAHNGPRWTKRHVDTIQSRLRLHIWPSLGVIPLGEITPPMCLQVCRNVEKGHPSNVAQRARQYMSAVFCYAIASGLTSTDPAAQIGRVLLPVSRKKHHPAILDIQDLRSMLKEVELSPGKPIAKLALRLLALTACRSTEVRGMRWNEIDWDERLWRIPAERMKMKRPHIVPLPQQAIDVLHTIKPFTGNTSLVFAGDRRHDVPISDATLSMRIKRSSYSGQHVPHGFRSSFSSIMNEKRPRDRSVIDMMLAHETRGTIEGAYNRAEHSDTKKEIAQEWANLLLEGAITLEELISTRRN